MSLLDFLGQLVGRIIGWSWLDSETQRADLTAADFLVRASIAAGLFVALLWLALR